MHLSGLSEHANVKSEAEPSVACESDSEHKWEDDAACVREGETADKNIKVAAAPAPAMNVEEEAAEGAAEDKVAESKKERFGKRVLLYGLPATAAIVLGKWMSAAIVEGGKSALTYAVANMVVDTFHYWEDEWLEVRSLKDRSTIKYSIAFANELHHFYPKALTLLPGYANVSDLVEKKLLAVLVAVAFIFWAVDWNPVRPFEVWAYAIFIVYNHAQCHKHRSLKNPIIRMLHDCWFLVKNSEQHAKHHELGSAGWSIATVNIMDIFFDNIVSKLLESSGGKKHIKEYQNYWSPKMHEIRALQEEGHAFTAAEKKEHYQHIEEQCKQFIEATPGWQDKVASEEAVADIPRRSIQSSLRGAQVGLDWWFAEIASSKATSSSPSEAGDEQNRSIS